MKGGETKLQLPPHLHLHLHKEPIPRAQHFQAGPGKAAGAEKAHSGGWAPFLPPASPLLQHRGRGPGLKMRCRALLTHYQPTPFLSPEAPPRSQTPEVVAFQSPRPDTVASLLGHCSAGSKFPTPRSLSVGPLGPAHPPGAQLRTEAAGQEGSRAPTEEHTPSLRLQCILSQKCPQVGMREGATLTPS